MSPNGCNTRECLACQCCWPQTVHPCHTPLQQGCDNNDQQVLTHWGGGGGGCESREWMLQRRVSQFNCLALFVFSHAALNIHAANAWHVIYRFTLIIYCHIQPPTGQVHQNQVSFNTHTHIYLHYSYLRNIGRGCENFQFRIGFTNFIVAHSIPVRFV